VEGKKGEPHASSRTDAILERGLKVFLIWVINRENSKATSLHGENREKTKKLKGNAKEDKQKRG